MNAHESPSTEQEIPLDLKSVTLLKKCPTQRQELHLRSPFTKNNICAQSVVAAEEETVWY